MFPPFAGIISHNYAIYNKFDYFAIGKTVLADDVLFAKVTAKYSGKKLGRMMFYKDPDTDHIYMAKEKHFGIYFTLKSKELFNYK